MEWLEQGCRRPLRVPRQHRAFSRSRSAQRPSLRKLYHFSLVLLVAASLLAPFKTRALESADPAARTGLRQSAHRMADPELSRVWAKGFMDPQFRSDRIMEGGSTYAASGNAAWVLGELGLLLTPPARILLQMLHAETSFNNISYNPHIPATIIGSDGTVMTQLPSTIGELSFKNIRLPGPSGGASFGSVEIRNIELGGTRIVVKRHD